MEAIKGLGEAPMLHRALACFPVMRVVRNSAFSAQGAEGSPLAKSNDDSEEEKFR